jgi:mediator of RNA polymerase II transcription subunit 6
MANGIIQLTISTQMQTFLSTASQHIHWTPSTGSTYFPPRQLTDSTTTGTQAVDSPSQSSQHHQKTTATASSFSNNASLLHSLALTNAYGHEYADENPLHGEPGAFVFASTTSHVEARNKAAAQAQAQAQAAAQGTGTGTPVPGSGVNSVAATPGVGVEGQSLSRKGSVVGIGQVPKVKRRKSKGPGSPVTPGAGQA